MHDIAVIRKLRASRTVKHILSCLLVALLIVQWGLIQHIESHLSGHNNDTCQLCVTGGHMANALAFTSLFTPVVPPETFIQLITPAESCCTPLISFLVRAPPLSRI